MWTHKLLMFSMPRPSVSTYSLKCKEWIPQAGFATILINLVAGVLGLPRSLAG